MAPTTDRQSYRDLVALVADQAREKLPQAVNGRVEHAVKLVLAHDVPPMADGSIIVGSSTDPLKTYILTGTNCECQDFQYGKAPEGWCAHRISAGIHKRVGQLLAAQPEPEVITIPEEVELVYPDNDWPEEEGTFLAPQTLPAPPLPEAPASVNVRVQVAGREVQWTLRDTDEARLAVRLEALLERYPMPQQTRQDAPQAVETAAPVCPYHGAMKASTKAP